MRTPAWLQRLEARIALALARAAAGENAQAAGANHVQAVNQAAIPPATSVTFQAPSFTTRSGHVRVLLFFSVNANGGTLAVGDVLELLGTRDGGVLNPAVGGEGFAVISNANEVAGSAKQICLGFDDSVAPGTSHAWGGQVSVIGGHTAGAAGAGQFDVIVQELPG